MNLAHSLLLICFEPSPLTGIWLVIREYQSRRDLERDLRDAFELSHTQDGDPDCPICRQHVLARLEADMEEQP